MKVANLRVILYVSGKCHIYFMENANYRTVCDMIAIAIVEALIGIATALVVWATQSTLLTL